MTEPRPIPCLAQNSGLALDRVAMSNPRPSVAKHVFGAVMQIMSFGSSLGWHLPSRNQHRSGRREQQNRRNLDGAGKADDRLQRPRGRGIAPPATQPARLKMP